MTTIRGSDVTYYTTLRLSEGAAPATVNRELATLGRLLNLAIEDELLWHRPKIRLLKEDNVRTGFFDCEHYEDVLRHLPEPLRPVITFAYVTGWRVNSEVLTLTWAQVDLKSGVVRLEPGQTKNRQGRQFYFTKTSALGRLLQSRRDAADRDQSETKSIIRHVFYRLVEKRGRHNKTPKPIKAFGKAWKTACRSAGCPGRIPHDLRRTAVRNLIRSGVPERAAMSATGHLTRSVFDRYHIVSETDLREASQRLDDYLGQQLGSQ
jgi:integrase